MNEVLGQGILREEHAFSNLLDALRLAASSARQLAYLREDRDWLFVQNNLEVMADRVTALAIRKLT